MGWYEAGGRFGRVEVWVWGLNSHSRLQRWTPIVIYSPETRFTRFSAWSGVPLWVTTFGEESHHLTSASSVGLTSCNPVTQRSTSFRLASCAREV